jgi:hypothetical protein
MTVFAMMSSEKLREKTEEPDQTTWRIEPFGWDYDDRTYYLLDDNRLYRQSEPLPPPAPSVRPSKKTKAGRVALRKRRRTTLGSVDGGDESLVEDEPEPADNGIGGCKWECVAVNLDQLTRFMNTIKKSRDENEQILHARLEESLLPIFERQEASQKRKEQAREKELLAMAKMATAKRSSRLAGKAEHQRIEQQAREEEERRRSEELAARKREAAALKSQQKTAMDREQRLQSRQDRIQERQAQRLRYEEDLAKLSGDDTSRSAGRMSQRRLQSEIEKNRQALQELDELEDDWIFDCVCGAYGQVDDGTHSISCERCNTWQHSACLGIGAGEAEAPDFHFVCEPCRQREAAAAAAKSASRSATPAVSGKEGDASRSIADGTKETTGDAAKASSEDELRDTDKAAPSVTNGDSNLADSPDTAFKARRDSIAKNAAMFPPPMEGDGLPVIPVKKPARQSLGNVSRPMLNELNGVQTPSATRTANPLSSSPPMKLAAPTMDSSPYLGPSKANGSPSLPPTLPPAISTPVGQRRASIDAHRGFPPSTPLGGTSPTSRMSMGPLPPSEHGISPVKHSSPVQRNGVHSGALDSERGSMSPTRKLAAASPIVPPTTALVPSPPPQINVSPQKNPTPARPPQDAVVNM